jgi:hypothetical protein
MQRTIDRSNNFSLLLQLLHFVDVRVQLPLDTCPASKGKNRAFVPTRAAMAKRAHLIASKTTRSTI